MKEGSSPFLLQHPRLAGDAEAAVPAQGQKLFASFLQKRRRSF